MPQYRSLWLFISIACLSLPVHAQPSSPFPKGQLSAQKIAQQTHLVAHGSLVRNALSKRNKDEVALIINRAPLEKRKSGSRSSVSRFETDLNNNPKNQAIDSIRMAILTSGKSRGTGMLLCLFYSLTNKGCENEASVH